MSSAFTFSMEPGFWADPVESAQTAGLRYISGEEPGIRRVGAGKGFFYVWPDGAPVKDPEALARIRSLVIPPAWKRVWICPDPRGHLQATGRDARGRKQYRYHPLWAEIRDRTKFDRMVVFATSLPAIRERVESDLRLPGLSRERVLATVVRLLEKTLIRVGNEEYARQNETFGLTTLRNRHVQVSGSEISFHFRGKSGKFRELALNDPRLARIVRGCAELPGQELFRYRDREGISRSLDSEDVNNYILQTTGRRLTAKDFRTWGATLHAARALAKLGPFGSASDAKKKIARAVREVSHLLGNGAAICRKYYIHPVVLDSYLRGKLLPRFQQGQDLSHPPKGLEKDEMLLLELLEEWNGVSPR